jgi:hypothetical protein
LRSFHFLRPCFCFDARADPSRPFSCVAGTVRSKVSDSFDCVGGLYCVCDECGPGSDWKYGHVLVDWSVCDAPADCGCLALSPYDPARDHGVSTMASGAGAGGAVVKTTGSSVREIADAAAVFANVRDLDCENESDEEDHVSEKSGRWKVSGPALEASENE